MLASLEALDSDLIAKAEAFEALTKQPACDFTRFAPARLAMTLASRRRATLLEATIYPTLSLHLPPADVEIVRNLRSDALRNLAFVSGHIGLWDTNRICERWAEYQAISAQMMFRLRVRIANERSALAPLIAKARSADARAVAEAERTMRIKAEIGRDGRGSSCAFPVREWAA